MHLSYVTNTLTPTLEHRLTCVEEYIKYKCSHDKNLDPSKIYLLFDIFIINQHQMAQVGHSQTVYDELVHTLSTMVKVGSEKEMLLALDSWSAPSMLGRLWCLFEIAVAAKNNINIHASLSSDSKREMYEAMIKDKDYVKKLFTSADVEVAKATVMSDRQFILGVVKELNLPGDNPFEGFNKLLAQTMEKWLATVSVCRSVFELAISLML